VGYGHDERGRSFADAFHPRQCKGVPPLGNGFFARGFACGFSLLTAMDQCNGRKWRAIHFALGLARASDVA
jgi:hypothetical protein